jgi:hypothetical protein
MIDKLRAKYPDLEINDSDDEIVNKCIDGIYTETDFYHACDMLIKYTKSKSIKLFRKKDVFIKYRNMERENFPEWIKNLSFDDQEALKDTYRSIVSYCFLDHNYFNCNHPDILELIHAYHKEEGIPYSCIRSNILRNLNCYIPIKKYVLIEVMNKGEKFKADCIAIFERVKEFREKNKDLIKGIIK